MAKRKDQLERWQRQGPAHARCGLHLQTLARARGSHAKPEHENMRRGHTGRDSEGKDPETGRLGAFKGQEENGEAEAT